MGNGNDDAHPPRKATPWESMEADHLHPPHLLPPFPTTSRLACLLAPGPTLSRQSLFYTLFPLFIPLCSCVKHAMPKASACTCSCNDHPPSGPVWSRLVPPGPAWSRLLPPGLPGFTWSHLVAPPARLFTNRNLDERGPAPSRGGTENHHLHLSRLLPHGPIWSRLAPLTLA